MLTERSAWRKRFFFRLFATSRLDKRARGVYNCFVIISAVYGRRSKAYGELQGIFKRKS